MPQALYDTDILLWSEQQAELLQRRSANALDWDNLAEGESKTWGSVSCAPCNRISSWRCSMI